MRTSISVLVAGACFFVSASAFAQPVSSKPGAAGYQEQKVDGGQSVIFKDDDLLAGDGAPLIAATGHPGRAFRANLIRPRTQFVAELLKTVESL